jgi:RNA polymerase sigma-70 factor (ECF subfamily)
MFLSFKKSISLRSDDDLLSEYAKDEDIRLLAELYLRYKSLIYGVCLKYLKNPDDAKDASMEIFEELLKKAAKHEIRNFKSWLYSLTRNHCLMQLRSAQKHTETELTQKDEPIVVEFPTEMHPIEEREVKFQQLESAIDELEEKQALCVRLFYLEEKSYQDVVDATGFDLKKVKSYIQNGKRNLKNKLS